jgi:hypothetical protein
MVVPARVPSVGFYPLEERDEAFHRIPGVFEILALHLHSVRRDRLLFWPARSRALSLGPASLIVEGMRKTGLPEGAVKPS